MPGYERLLVRHDVRRVDVRHVRRGWVCPVGTSEGPSLFTATHGGGSARPVGGRQVTEFVSLREAVELVHDGDRLALTGFSLNRNAVAAIHELIRAGVRDLRVSQVIGGLETDLLVGAGCVDELTFSAGSLDRFGTLQALNRRISRGQVTCTEYSSLALASRYLAAALGLPYFPSKSMLGSDLIDPLVAGGDVRVDTDPFSGQPVALVAPLQPDVAILHVDAADRAGNLHVGGPTWTMREIAYSARSVMGLCEEIVEVGELDPASVLVPGPLVDSVSLVPYGAHPTAVYQRYDYDADHLWAYVASAQTDEGFNDYLERYVLQSGDHAGYLEVCGVLP